MGIMVELVKSVYVFLAFGCQSMVRDSPLPPPLDPPVFEDAIPVGIFRLHKLMRSTSKICYSHFKSIHVLNNIEPC
jgi:hypothetical protein